MNIEVEIRNLPEVQRAFKKAPNIMRKAFGEGLQKAAFATEREAKLAITDLVYSRPRRSNYVRTGHLRDFIKVSEFSLTGLYVIVKNDVNYAYYVHEGRGTSRAYGRRPYMEIGAQKAKIDSVVNAELIKGIKSIK